uniref:Unkown protein n=1 Tax=Riptortus pedestris TaxID=329032 RepID=R4WU48_RIPPE|nr:unkown protein [Riptortus pedestris]
MSCHRAHPNLESLKQSLVRTVQRFPQEVLRAAIDDWSRRLKACVKAKGEHFE